MLEYETANPGQDFDEREQEFFDPTKDTTRPIVNLASDGSAFVEEGSSRPDSGLPDLEHPGPPLEHPPPIEEREQGQESGRGRGRSAMKGGRASRGGSSGEWAAMDEGGAHTPDTKRYSKGPDAEAGKALPKDAGRV